MKKANLNTSKTEIYDLDVFFEPIQYSNKDLVLDIFDRNNQNFNTSKFDPSIKTLEDLYHKTRLKLRLLEETSDKILSSDNYVISFRNDLNNQEIFKILNKNEILFICKNHIKTIDETLRAFEEQIISIFRKGV